MTDDELTPQRVATLTAAVDIEASPPDGEPVATLCSVAVHGAAGRARQIDGYACPARDGY